jgi:hypothetical protein
MLSPKFSRVTIPVDKRSHPANIFIKNLLICAHSYATHELWHIITETQNSLQKWNDEMRAFLAQERKEMNEIVTL